MGFLWRPMKQKTSLKAFLLSSLDGSLRSAQCGLVCLFCINPLYFFIFFFSGFAYSLGCLHFIDSLVSVFGLFAHMFSYLFLMISLICRISGFSGFLIASSFFGLIFSVLWSCSYCPIAQCCRLVFLLYLRQFSFMGFPYF